MNEFTLTLLFGILGKVTFLLLSVLVIALLLRRAEPRWRVLLIRGAILVTPIVVVADFLEPQLHLGVPAQERLLLPEAEPLAAVSIESTRLEQTDSGIPAVVPSEREVRVPGGAWFLIWLAGALALLIREALRLSRATGDVSETLVVNPVLLREWKQVCADMGVKAPEVKVAPGKKSPYLIPGLRRTLVLPQTLAGEEGLPLARHVFRHEAAHLKNGDEIWIPLSRLLSCLVWFHPLAWVLSSLHGQACEEAADAEAARQGGVETYQGALAELALALVPAKVPAATILRFPSVRSRLRLVPGFARRQPPARWLAVGILGLLGILGGIVGTVGLAQDDGESSAAKVLEEIQVPRIEFQSTDLEAAVEYLRHLSRELDPGGKGIDILISNGVPRDQTITLKLSNVPLLEALRYTTQLAGSDFRVDEHAVVIVPRKKEVLLKEVGHQWEETDLPDEGAVNDVLKGKLHRIVIPHLEFHDTPLQDALEFLRLKSRELDSEEPDPARKGINLILKQGVDIDEKLTLKLTNVPLAEALRYSAELVNASLVVEAHAVVLRSKKEVSNLLYTRAYAGVRLDDTDSAKEVLEAAGVEFGEGASAILNRTTATLIVRNTEEELKKVEAFVERRMGEEDPADIWLQGYLALQSGEKHLEEGDRLAALAEFQEAQGYFDYLARTRPDWKSQLVTYRRNRLQEVIAVVKADGELPRNALLSDSILTIQGAAAEHIVESDGSLRVTLNLKVTADASANPQWEKTKVDVRFYEVVNGRKLERVKSPAEMRLLSAPGDWKNGVESVEVVCRLKADPTSQREYFGYLIELSHDGVLQYVTASPSKLVRMAP